MGLFEFLSEIDKHEAPITSDRCCKKCFHVYYSDGMYKCSNPWAPSDFRIMCKRDPYSVTDCPKYDYKKR